MKMYEFGRSSASWRLRIALNLKGLVVDHIDVSLGDGDQHMPEYRALNPQALVPTLILDDGTILTQAPAIIEWLEETHPTPPLLPKDAITRAKVRAVSYAIVCDTHPLQNLRVLQAVEKLTGSADTRKKWATDINAQGLAACEVLLSGQSGPFAFGVSPTFADICIVPQMGNARRYNIDLEQFPRLLALEAACNALPAFANASPKQNPR